MKSIRNNVHRIETIPQKVPAKNSLSIRESSKLYTDSIEGKIKLGALVYKSARNFRDIYIMYIHLYNTIRSGVKYRIEIAKQHIYDTMFSADRNSFSTIDYKFNIAKRGNLENKKHILANDLLKEYLYEYESPPSYIKSYGIRMHTK